MMELIEFVPVKYLNKSEKNEAQGFTAHKYLQVDYFLLTQIVTSPFLTLSILTKLNKILLLKM